MYELNKQPTSSFIVVAAILLIGVASNWLHRHVLPKRSQATKLWITTASGLLLIALLLFAP